VNWNIVSSSKEKRGLGIRDLELDKIALGAKILWILISGNKEWWKTTIFKKYKMGTRKICIDQEQVSHNGSPIWKIFHSSIPHIKEKPTWILGNGKSILLWKDSIMGSPPPTQKQ
jgi:hypothetical protein